MPYDPESHKAPELLPLQIRRVDAPYLVNLLADNARPWNAYLRDKLTLFVNDTDAYNARRKLMGIE